MTTPAELAEKERKKIAKENEDAWADFSLADFAEQGRKAIAEEQEAAWAAGLPIVFKNEAGEIVWRYRDKDGNYIDKLAKDTPHPIRLEDL
ncbi:MAG: hypothetical protein V7739_20085 [Motiliproteus sp.]